MIEPLHLSFEIACPADHAFRTWTERFAAWWPKGHSTSGDPASVHLEPGVGGRIFERTKDGVEIVWGEITAWEPPRRLAYLWHIGHEADHATDVELTFVPLGDDATRLDIVHSGFDRLGAAGPAYREGNTAGWTGLIPHFVTEATATTTEPTQEQP